MPKTIKYDASSIKVLTGLEAVRAKPAFYIGSEGTGENASVGFWTVAMAETLANAMDECRSGFANHLVVVVDNKTHTYTVMDNGRGIPIEKHTKTGMSTLDTVFTQLHAGGKMDKDSTYKVSIGTFGVGAAVACALSKSMEVWTFRNKKWYYQLYRDGGKPAHKFPVVVKAAPTVGGIQAKQGTIVQVRPDMEFFDKTLKVDVEQVENFLTNSLYFVENSKVNLVLDGKKVNLKSEPPAQLVKDMAEIYECETLHEPFTYRDETLEVIFCWSTYSEPSIFSYVCGVDTADHGVHYNGFVNALEGAIMPLKGRNKFEMQDLIVGMIGIINVNITAPAFSNAIKTKLTTKGLDTEITNKLQPLLKKWAAKNKELIQERCKLAGEFAKLRTSKKDEKKLIADLSTKRGGILLPHKLAQAPKCKSEQRELFIVEGDSAAGTVKQARDSTFQEVLPIKGKISNACKTPVNKLVQDESVRDILLSIGYNPKAEDPTGNLRCGKILFLADADVDGIHINMLLIALFQTLVPELFTQGKIYVVKGDLFLYRHNDGKKTYADSLEALKTKVGKGFNPDNVGRLKGWSEAEVSVVKPMAMAPGTRKIQKIGPLSNSKFDEYYAMMSADTTYRKELLGLA